LHREDFVRELQSRPSEEEKKRAETSRLEKSYIESSFNMPKEEKQGLGVLAQRKKAST